MLKLAILKPRYDEDDKLIGWSPVFESEDGMFEFELTERVFDSLGGKDAYSGMEIRAAIKTAFKQYKTNFKEKTVNLP